MTEDISKMKSIRAAYKGHCTQDFKKAEKLITSTSSPLLKVPVRPRGMVDKELLTGIPITYLL